MSYTYNSNAFNFDNKEIKFNEGFVNSGTFLVKFESGQQFRQFCDKLNDEGILGFDNNVKFENGVYQAYLLKSFKKDFFRHIFTGFDDWVLIFRFRYQDGELNYQSTWNEGKKGQVAQINFTPSDNLSEKERIIKAEIRNILNQHYN